MDSKNIIQVHIDQKKAKQAADEIDEIRKSGVFNQGKPSLEIIKEWRRKRR